MKTGLVKRALAVALFVIGGAAGAAGQVRIAENFAGRTDGYVDGKTFETTSVDWEYRDGALTAGGGRRSLAMLALSPYGGSVKAEARVVVAASGPDQWNVAGLVIAVSENDFWHLALVESPASKGKRRFIELSEMKGGVWNAQGEGGTKLTRTAAAGLDFEWRFGETYILRLELDKQGVSGSVIDGRGRIAANAAYRFDGEAVSFGRPGVDSAGFASSFFRIDAEISDIRDAPKTPISAVPWSVRKGNGPARKGTGFFTVGEADGVWWFFDPAGQSFFFTGTDHANYNGAWCEALGYSPYLRNAVAKYGSEDRWSAETLARLRSWGFNALAVGNGQSLRHRGLPHTELLHLGTDFAAVDALVPKVNWTGVPNVFSPKFKAWCEKTAELRCFPLRDDPWLVGYQIDNELEWYGKPPAGSMRSWALSRPAGDPARAAAEATDEEGFIKLVAELYFKTTSEAIHKYDSNHLVMGCRFAGRAPDAFWSAAGRYCEVVTVNLYPRIDLESGDASAIPLALETGKRLSSRPLMITEWSFPALDAVDSAGRRLPNRHGAGMRVDTQAQKARAAGLMQTRLFSLPYVIGSSWFKWVDQPALGVRPTFPEDSNYGLVDDADRPYGELTALFAALNPLAERVHSGGAEAEALALVPPLRLPAAADGSAGTQAAAGTAAGSLPGPALPSRPPTFTREGLKVSIDAGRLTLSRDAASPDAWDRLALDGRSLGRFALTIRTFNDADRWVQPDRLVSIASYKETGDSLIVDMEFSRERLYGALWRFTFHPGADFFTVRALAIWNTGPVPLRLAGYYHFAFSALAPAGDVPGGPGVPNYWLPVASWVNPASALQYGVLSHRVKDFDLSFYIDDKGREHPDAFRRLDRLLKPGERWESAEPELLVFGAPASESQPEIMSRLRQTKDLNR